MTPICTRCSSPASRGDAASASARPAPRRHRSGFTLIELMIAIAVVGILASIALPSYTDYVRRGRITEATNALATLRVRLEQYFQDNGNYGSSAGGCGVAAISTDAFDLACSDSGGGSGAFVASATGKASKGMDGYRFTIDQDNRRRTTAFPDTSGLPLDCWIDRKGASC